MGSVSAMESLNRVLARHGDELQAELRTEYPSPLIRRFSLENAIYHIAVEAELVDGTVLSLQSLDIDELAERYPDCDIGY